MAQDSVVSLPDPGGDEHAVIDGLIERGRAAMAAFANADQATVDDAVTAIAWAIYEPGRARDLAEIAVRDTGLGNVADKVAKNQRKTFGALRDLLAVKTVGVIEQDPALGLTKYAKPVGVVAAVCPSTNPAATPVNKAMFAIKGRNAVIIAPSPAGLGATTRTVDFLRAELTRAGHPADLVQVLPAPVSKTLTERLMEAADLVVVTGSQNNVRRAYRSGTPAIGVGTGNVPVIIDTTADLDDAAAKIALSKCFDNATSCSSENALFILDEVYDAAIAALERAGGYLADAAEGRRIEDVLWVGGKLNRKLIAKDAAILAEAAALAPDARSRRFFMVEETGIGEGYPLSGEKLSLVLTVYRVRDFDDAIDHARRLLDHQGKGHSCGLHTKNALHATRLAEELDVARVLINQAHAMGNGGSFDNGLNFTLSMGCGTWAGNSISENLNYRHFINITHLSTVIPERRPTEDDLFGPYFARHGQ